MTPLILWIAAVALSCVFGAALFSLVWPRDHAGGSGGRRLAPSVVLMAALLSAGAAGTILFANGFPHETSYAWIRAALIAGAGATGVLLGAWIIGDRARARRRCPRCWYSMAGAPVGANLTCPECGRTARSERALLRSRRGTRLLLAAFMPLIACGVLCGVAFFSDPKWPRRMPNSALALAAPFAGCDTRIAAELEVCIWVYMNEEDMFKRANPDYQPPKPIEPESVLLRRTLDEAKAARGEL